MHASPPRRLATFAVLAVLGGAQACGTHDEQPFFPTPDTSSAGTTGVAGTTGAAGTSGAAGTTGVAGTTSLTGNAGTSPVEPPAQIELVAPTPGCGVAPTQDRGVIVRATIMTMGTKPDTAADSTKGPWAYEREYFLSLPRTYDQTHAYPLVIEGTNCGGRGNNTFLFATPSYATANPVIHVGLTPPPNAIGHATNPNIGCFDDREGDDSVDWAFYEALYDRLAATTCFDRNRVFVSGFGSGAIMANELACKYAGDPTRPVRAVMTSKGGLPGSPTAAPTCTTKPLAGMWVAAVGDATYPFADVSRAITRAMQVNGCAPATTYETAKLETFSTYPQPDGTCKRIAGCPTLYPLVVCTVPDDPRTSLDHIVNPGFTWFIEALSAPTSP
jgi:hypothetical protein